MPSTPDRTIPSIEMPGIIPSHPGGIAIDVPAIDEHAPRPSSVRHMSAPAYESPLRHHRRKPSTPRQIKETLHAHSEYTNSEDDGAAVHRINQYAIKQEIGRGSFGAVHLAVDQHGTEFAVKEFSKSRLRKRAQSNILRRPHGALRPGHLKAGMSLNLPLHRHSASDIHDEQEQGNPLYLIKEEIAIMKKLNHTNLVSLIEVLDDPDEDSLYMVLEMCQKGVVMKVGIGERADPYDPESCRCWFRDLILGIEYLHAQGVVHRDIKPDNLLLTADEILKIVDFGVSEMFEKHSDMKTAKSAGSPAFLPPELCVSKHGDVSGKAADIWSMGVTLYCLRFGRIPFEKTGVLDLYESIKNDEVELEGDLEEEFKDLMHRILEKDPAKRITLPELRNHPWVTKGGTDPLLSEEENTAELIEPPTQEEINSAVTGNLSNLMVVMKAVTKFKSLLARKRPALMESILGKDTRIVQPPLQLSEPQGSKRYKTRSVDAHDRRPVEQALVAEGVHRDLNWSAMDEVSDSREDTAVLSSPTKRKTSPNDENGHHREGRAHPEDHRSHGISSTGDSNDVKLHGKGQAHNPLEDYLFLQVGPGGRDEPPDPPAVSESPPATDPDIYETAYHEEVERIRTEQGRRATFYLTRRVDHQKYAGDENIADADKGQKAGSSGLANLLRKVREHGGESTK